MIFIDDRMGSKDLVNYHPLSTLGTLVHLPSADIAFPGNGPNGSVTIGVELKKVTELLSSMNSGRLQGRQVLDMLESYDVCWLLYYGIYRPGPRPDFKLQIFKGVDKRGKEVWENYSIGSREFPYGYLEKFLMTLTAAGFHIKHVMSISEGVNWITCLYEWWSKPWNKHKGLNTFDNSRNIVKVPGMNSRQLAIARVANALPVRIGYQKAVSAGKHFSSIREMINASAEEWEQVPEIGKVLARSAARAVD